MSDSAINRLINKKKAVPQRVDSLLSESDTQEEVEQYAKMFIRIDSKINLKIKSLCLKHKISRETFFEAACDYLLSNSESLNVVVESARQRSKKRKDEGIKKRAKSMSSHR